ncbi:MAG TPA: glycosyltransferase family 1 protein [Actinophytocola sp.]|uniref:glycosyltransferase family 4 protein n=1 Tax=Actinophytocola sp. TaxID=1872138 RepID=UPI002DB90360|nr:glycosyltransferase family 1 protein [Actinophytocola sp.]HEU5474139.1 glycosyltransferase family 1 protein [Actinophytocola sp.]
MRIAVITESFLPTVNGVTNSVCRILRHFSERGHQAVVVAPGAAPASYAGHPVVGVGGVSLPGYRSFVLGLPTVRLDGLLRDFRPDVVHLASPFAIGAAGAAAARRLGVPCVAVFQTDVAGFLRRYGFRGTDRAVWAWLRRIHGQADRTLVPSTATFGQLRERGLPRLAMWRRGVDSERFHPRHRDGELRARLAGPDAVLVGYVGRLSRDKRVHLLAGLADLPGIRLVIVGDGPAADRLRTRLPGAEFLGLRQGQALSTIYASLDVFVHTGADETFCQALQEAMASGVPVVAPAAGGPLDLVEHGRTGLLYPPDSMTELRDGVHRLVADPGLRARYGWGGRAAVRGRTWTVIGDQLLEHYTGVLRGELPHGSRAIA